MLICPDPRCAVMVGYSIETWATMRDAPGARQCPRCGLPLAPNAGADRSSAYEAIGLSERERQTSARLLASVFEPD